MMEAHASEVWYNQEEGIVTIDEEVGKKKTFAEDITRLDLVAGDDVSVRVDQEVVHVEALTAEPLIVRRDEHEVQVLTMLKPDAEVEVDGKPV